MSHDHPEALKKEIFNKVKTYYELFHKKEPFVPGKTKINYAGRVYDEREMINIVDTALDFWLTAGPYAGKLEKAIKDYFDSLDMLLVNSGSSANLLMVSALMSRQMEGHLEPGDEVITPAVTFPTTLAPLLQNGLVPVLVDCEAGTYNIDPDLIEEAITEKTRALFIPHTLGNPCDMEKIVKIVKRSGLFLLEDVCDAFGSRFDGRLVGTYGNMASLSFYPAHHLTLGEGGGVLVNDPALKKIALSIRDWGRDCWCASGQNDSCGKRFKWQLGDLPYGYDHKYIYSNPGYNLKVTDMQAAIGSAQLDKVDGFIRLRKANFKKYFDAFKKYEEYLILPKADPRADPSWFGFPITVRNGIERLQLIEWLEDANIETRLIFGGNIIRQPAFKDTACRCHGSLEESDRVMNDAFFIGVYPGLTAEMTDFVTDRFDKFFDGRV
jgi:CDP-6-deoxy-D-xylo-4-hexulose-3-dehydrase